MFYSNLGRYILHNHIQQSLAQCSFVQCRICNSVVFFSGQNILNSVDSLALMYFSLGKTDLYSVDFLH